MKCLKWLTIPFLCSTLASAEVPQDIVIKTRFDLESSEAFINQLRIFLVNNNFGDPYSQELARPLKVDLAKALDEIPPDTQAWIRELQSVLSVNVFESDYQMIVEKLSYTVNEFNSEFKTDTASVGRVDYVTVSYVKGLCLRADKVVFQVELKKTQTKEPIRFKVELLRPEFIVNPELTAELSLGWMTSILPENFQLSLTVVDIEKLMAKIVRRPDLIDLNVADVTMPNVSVRIGNKEIKFDKNKIKNFFSKNQGELKKGILDLLNVRMKDRFSNIIKDSPQQLLLPKTFGIKSEINGVFDLQKMSANQTGIIQVEVDGHFCSRQVSGTKDICANERIGTKLRRKIELADYQKSIREINRSLIEKKTNIAVSVSEDYLNQLVAATVNSGLWEEKLKGRKFKLGPEHAFVLAEEKGETFSLYLDIIYQLSGAQRILVGRSELRFPVRFKIALSFEEIQGVPHFLIQVKEVATDDKLLINGAPEFGLPTTVNSVRFQNKVLAAIHEEVDDFAGEILVDLEMKELEGTTFTNLEFFSDGLGRGTATLGFGDKNEAF
ncbi:hypothetical protein ACJVC5_07960 [Peredibacter sp. HCB2-198]|uniref:hypothetical protein n=1 Tax=Peredibacter sp. HCB2-198 TaxID=3383025 RepID=UPI0038B5324E